MTAIGVGVGVGFGGVGLSPAWLHSQRKAVFGDKLIEHWVGADIVADGSSNIMSWPGRVSAQMDPLSTGRFALSSANGRLSAFNADVGQMSGYTSAISVTTSMFVVVVGTITTVPFANYSALVSQGDGWGLMGKTGTSDWFIPGTTYRNGVLTDTAVSGLAVYESRVTNTNRAYFDIGCDRITGAARNHRGSILDVVLLSSALTAGERASDVANVKRYYRIP